METPPDFSHASYAIIRSESISQGGMSLPSMKRMKLLRVEGSRENDEAGRSPACDKTAHDIGPVTSSGQEVCKGHAASQFLHKGDVHDRYGVPEKEGSQQRHPLIPAEKNRSTTFCKMGAVHAGDRGPLQYSRLPIPSSHYRQTGHGREKAIYQRIPSYQQIFESHWERTRPVRPPDPLRRAPFLGQCGPE